MWRQSRLLSQDGKLAKILRSEATRIEHVWSINGFNNFEPVNKYFYIYILLHCCWDITFCPSHESVSLKNRSWPKWRSMGSLGFFPQISIYLLQTDWSGGKFSCVILCSVVKFQGCRGYFAINLGKLWFKICVPYFLNCQTKRFPPSNQCNKNPFSKKTMLWS